MPNIQKIPSVTELEKSLQEDLKSKAIVKSREDKTFLTELGISSENFQDYLDYDYLQERLISKRVSKIDDFNELLRFNRKATRQFLEKNKNLEVEGFGVSVLLSEINRRNENLRTNLRKSNKFVTEQLKQIDYNFSRIEESKTRIEYPIFKKLIPEQAEESIKKYKNGNDIVKTSFQNLYEKYGIPKDKLPKQYRK